MILPNHRRLINLTVFLFLLLVPVLVFAQGADVTEAINIEVDWKALLPFLINAIMVPLAVQLIKKFLPQLSPGAKQILALVAGPILTPVAVWLSSLLGATIDLTLVIMALGGAISGLAGIGVHNVAKRAKSKVVLARSA
jgi:hypothetical protein